MKMTIRIPGSSVCVDMPDEDCRSRYKTMAMDLIKESLWQVKEAAPKSTIEPEETKDIEIEDWGPDEDTGHERFEARGILSIECQDCGKRTFINAREPIDHFICRECDWVTMFDRPLKQVNVSCPCCGHSYYFKTNSKENEFEANCRACKAPVTVKYNEKKDQYYSVGEESECE